METPSRDSNPEATLSDRDAFLGQQAVEDIKVKRGDKWYTLTEAAALDKEPRK
jgi:hypothetical protein